MSHESNRLGPVLGAEIRGLDLSQPIDDATFGQMRQTWLDHDGFLVIRDQHLTEEQQIAFSRRFGPLFGEADHFQESVHKYLHPAYPAIFRVSNKVADGQVLGRERTFDLSSA